MVLVERCCGFEIRDVDRNAVCSGWVIQCSGYSSVFMGIARYTRVASVVCFECVHEGVSHGSWHAKLRRGCARYTEILLIPNCVVVIATLLFGGGITAKGKDTRGTFSTFRYFVLAYFLVVL